MELVRLLTKDGNFYLERQLVAVNELEKNLTLEKCSNEEVIQLLLLVSR